MRQIVAVASLVMLCSAWWSHTDFARAGELDDFRATRNFKGKVRKRIGKSGNGVGQFLMPHMLAFDGDGNLFVAEVNGQRMQKFLRKTRDTPARP